MRNRLLATASRIVASSRRSGGDILTAPAWLDLRAVFWLGFYLLVAGTATAAEPFTPSSDNQVLEKLPRTFLSSREEVIAIRRGLSSNPSNVQQAIQAARRFFEMGNVSGDPRFFGYAQAAIQDWWDQADAPANVLQLRAKLKEKNHRYDEAIADLRTLLHNRPDDVQAWFELANIQRVQGKYEQASAACEELSERAGVIASTMCPCVPTSVDRRSGTGLRRLGSGLVGSAAAVAWSRALDH